MSRKKTKKPATKVINVRMPTELADRITDWRRWRAEREPGLQISQNAAITILLDAALQVASK